MKGTLAAGGNAASCCVAKCILVILAVACNLPIVRAGTLTGASVSLSNTIAGSVVDFTVRFTTATTISEFKAISVTGVNFVVAGNVLEQINCSDNLPGDMMASFISPNILKIASLFTVSSVAANSAVVCTWNHSSSHPKNSQTAQSATTVTISTFANNNINAIDSVSGIFYPQIVASATTTAVTPPSTAVTSKLPATTSTASTPPVSSAPPVTQTPCPVDLFMGDWSGSCIQTVGMNSTCASPDDCATAGVANLRLSPGWNAVPSAASCTQKYDFRFFKVGAAIHYEYTSGALIGSCANANTSAPLHAFLQRGDPLQHSFSTNVVAFGNDFFGSTATTCALVLGSSAPTAATSGTFLLSVSPDGRHYREYGAYDTTMAYQSPFDAALNPDTFTTVLPTNWSMYGRMFSNAAISARPTGSPPMTAASTVLSSVAGSPVFSYKCTAQKKVVAESPDSSKTKSNGNAIVASVWLLLLCAFAFMY
jgi:hypothetical protein